jgi:hypothetical protein
MALELFEIKLRFRENNFRTLGSGTLGEAVFSFFRSGAFWSYFFISVIHSPSKVMR